MLYKVSVLRTNCKKKDWASLSIPNGRLGMRR